MRHAARCSSRPAPPAGGQAGKLGGEGVQRRLIGRRAGQVGAGTGRRAPAQLGPADVVVRTALSGLGKQLLPAPGAEQQAGQQGPPVVHRRGPVRGEQLLNGPPRRAGHQGGVPPQGDDPLAPPGCGGSARRCSPASGRPAGPGGRRSPPGESRDPPPGRRSSPRRRGPRRSTPGFAESPAGRAGRRAARCGR